jgi:hypothetical protein
MIEPIQVTLLVINVFETLGISYLIGGSFASTAYGRIRTTQDVDIIAFMEPSHVDSFAKRLDSVFYLDETMIRDAITRQTNFNLIHLETMFKVDIFLPKDRPFDHNQLTRRVKRAIDKESAREVYFSSPEDTILAKLEWYRLGDEVSEVHWRDIKGILRQRSDQLDMAYLNDSAQAMQLADLLERCLEEFRSTSL